MSQDIRLYASEEVWDQPLALGQRNLLQAILDFWPQGMRSVLDVGCGDGKLSSQLVNKGVDRLVGLDSSEEALRRLPFSAVKADATELPFSDRSFDLVMSTDALEHMPQSVEAAAWDEMFRVADKAVMVAVPFGEELLDATAQCAGCGQHYHVNWHQRSYDLADIHHKAPAGWIVGLTVLAGEPWSALLPPETHFRRQIMGEWAGWEASICPACNTSGQRSAEIEPLSGVWAESLAGAVYSALSERRYCRSHSEILVFFTRDAAAIGVPSGVEPEVQIQPASHLDLTWQVAVQNLHPLTQVAQYVEVAGGGWRAQFPAYESQPAVEVRRWPGSQGDVLLRFEDAAGCLFEEHVLKDGEASVTLTFSRPVVPGYYGVLASCEKPGVIASIGFGAAPAVHRMRPRSPGQTAYLPLQQQMTGRNPSDVFVQVPEPTWFDPEMLAPITSSASSRILHALCFQVEQAFIRAQDAQKAPVAETNRLQVRIQNLTAERDALLERLKDADRLAVQVQNLTAERDGLLKLRAEQEGQAVELQNVTADRDALLERAQEADRLAVQVENLTAERDGLMQLRAEQEGQAVELQNVTAERDALLERAQEVDRLAVQVQNLTAERDGLLQLRAEQEGQAVELQNLTAERDALLDRAKDADRLAVQLQNITAERDALLDRSAQAERLAVQVQNLDAERSALLIRAKEADRLAVDLQNLQQAHGVLLEKTALAKSGSGAVEK